MIIKKYNDFVKTNEEFVLGAPGAEPVVKPQEPTTIPTRPGIEERPAPPQIIPDEQQSDLPAPAKAELPEEEGGEYMGQKMMADLASALNVNLESDGSVNFEGKKINFYSETEKFHVDKKKFDTVEQVLSYLQGENKSNKLSDIDEDEFEKGDMPFESKSYKNLRKRK